MMDWLIVFVTRKKGDIVVNLKRPPITSLRIMRLLPIC